VPSVPVIAIAFRSPAAKKVARIDGSTAATMYLSMKFNKLIAKRSKSAPCALRIACFAGLSIDNRRLQTTAR
jgi:hypothetical protein